MPLPLLLIHGYSADGAAMLPLKAELVKRGLNPVDINIGNYISLNNEITIKDLGEGLERAIQNTALKADEQFDAIVHSTGMLVVRSWLVNHPATVEHNSRLRRLKHLIGVAPATWGSPQAHMGRTFLGALVKGNREFGPDFLNAGNEILDGLELGSKFTWDLAHLDLLGAEPFFGTGPETPYVAVFIGNQGYDGIASVANSPGSDGTVRWAGCGLNARKITLDLTQKPFDQKGQPTLTRVSISDWAAGQRLSVPMIPVDGRDHGTLIAKPDDGMVDLIARFLTGVGDAASYEAWLTDAQKYGERGLGKMQVGPGNPEGVVAETLAFVGHLLHLAGKPLDGWQQFVIHCQDEHGDPVKDFLIEVFRKDGEKWVAYPALYADVHAYSTDPSYRCFSVQLEKGISTADVPLQIRIHASTGTELVGYLGYGTSNTPVTMRADAQPVVLEITSQLPGGGSLFHPFTTTLVEITLDREPYPFDKISQVFNWIAAAAEAAQD